MRVPSARSPLLHVLLVCSLVLSGCLWNGDEEPAGDGPDAGAPGADGPTSMPDLSSAPTPRPIGADEVMITADQGGMIEVGGASLTLPPGSLDRDASIGLVEFELPEIETNETHTDPSGLVPLTDHSFVLTTDRLVNVSGALVIELPFDPERLDPDAGAESVKIASSVLGLLVPQNGETEVDLDRGVVRYTLAADGTTFLPNDGPTLPRGYGVAFLWIAGKLISWATGKAISALTGGTLLDALFGGTITVVQDATLRSDLSSHLTEHFLITYRGPSPKNKAISYTIEDAEAQRIGRQLEMAHSFLVDELGFRRPDVITGQIAGAPYPIFLNDFKYHPSQWKNELSWNPADWLQLDTAGATVPGSSLSVGGSWINLRVGNVDDWTRVAIHEYVHALQPGLIEDLVPNAHRSFWDPEGSWLFEGTAAALTGRIVDGGRFQPAVDPTVIGHLRTLASIYDTTANDPQDAAEDLFVYLERRLGGPEYYADIFRTLGDASDEGVEPSVDAVDRVLMARGIDDGLRGAWKGFVAELVFHPTLFAGGMADVGWSADGKWAIEKTLSSEGVYTDAAWNLPPLSYDHMLLTIPSIERDRAGNPVDGTRTTLEVTLEQTGGTPGAWASLQLPDGTTRELDAEAGGGRATLTLTNVRADEEARIHAVVANPNLGVDQTASFELGFQFLEPSEAPTVDLCPDAFKAYAARSLFDPAEKDDPPLLRWTFEQEGSSVERRNIIENIDWMHGELPAWQLDCRYTSSAGDAAQLLSVMTSSDATIRSDGGYQPVAFLPMCPGGQNIPHPMGGISPTHAMFSRVSTQIHVPEDHTIDSTDPEDLGRQVRLMQERAKWSAFPCEAFEPDVCADEIAGQTRWGVQGPFTARTGRSSAHLVICTYGPDIADVYQEKMTFAGAPDPDDGIGTFGIIWQDAATTGSFPTCTGEAPEGYAQELFSDEGSIGGSDAEEHYTLSQRGYRAMVIQGGEQWFDAPAQLLERAEAIAASCET